MSTRSETAPRANEVLSQLTSRMRQIGIFLALIAIVVFFQVVTGGKLLTAGNVANIIVQNSYILILAIGMVMIIIAGHIDLSVGSVAAFVGAISGVMVVHWGWPWWIGIIAALLVGALVGAWQGFWVAVVGIPAFIVTLAGMLIFRGLTQMVLSNTQITPFPREYRQLGGGYLFPQLFPASTSPVEWITLGLGVLTLVLFVGYELRERAKVRKMGLEPEARTWFLVRLIGGVVLLGYLTYLLGMADGSRGTPIVLIVLAALIVGYTMVMGRTVFGRHIYAIGGNRHAADLSGIKSRRIDFWLFVNMGVLAALAGLVFTGRLNSAGPGAGNLFELDAIAAAFIGGAAVQGGVGRIIGAITGGLIMGVLNNGMSLLGVGTDSQQFIKGMVLLLAVAFDVWNKRRQRV
ncbi:MULTISPECIES: multiple monosaccharide ABC transporter permease [Microbacterium]|uniref:multiple monosaccharide ABC transporter permease n=1 Tax=Microbacterium TaxID=33882 RepID=UPI001956B068|nr:multiple monosaccharide ABC transporter permease [Microbacterium esteraromaticum]MBM7465098.1 putative multiple sugar transport system permease protein [Microbacterium esteraromaticum]